MTISTNTEALNATALATRAIHAGQEPDPTTGAVVTPIYMTSTFKQDGVGGLRNGYDYSRSINPTRNSFDEQLAAVEGANYALSFASGLAAIDVLLRATLKPGDNILLGNDVYGGTYRLLSKVFVPWGVGLDVVDITDTAAVSAALSQKQYQYIWVETPSNPLLNITDIAATSAVAHAHDTKVVVDNTFASPYLFRPLEHGADVVVESATKFIGGHGTTLGGVIVEGGKFNWAEVPGKFPTLTEPDPSYHGLNFYEALGGAAFVTRVRAILLRDTGATLSPFAAFLLLQGVETLSLRLERHAENTKKVVEFLANHPQVEHVNHPSLPNHPDHALYEKYFPNGGASIFTFNIKGGREEAFKFIDNLKIFSLLANVADVKSLVIHPASTTHSQLNDEELAEQQIYQNTIRLSIGLENIDDIIEDLESGFKALRESGLAK